MPRRAATLALKPIVAVLLGLLVAWSSGARAQAPAASPDGAERVVVAFGDSLIHGYGLPDGQTLPDQLQAALRARGLAVRVVNAGVSGDTSAGGLERLDWSLAERPDLFLLGLGSNDFLRSIDPAVTRRNIDAMLARLRGESVPVVLLGNLAPRNLGPDYVAAFDAIYPELAAQYGADLYPFLLEGVALVPELNQPDGIHPNAAGVARIVEGLAPVVEAALRRQAAPDGGGPAIGSAAATR